MPVVLFEKFSSVFPFGAGWRGSTPAADNRSRGKQVSFLSISDGEFVREPSVPVAVKFASFSVNLLALALPLSIMQVYDRIIPNHSSATLAYLFLGLTLVIAFDYVGTRRNSARRSRTKRFHASFELPTAHLSAIPPR